MFSRLTIVLLITFFLFTGSLARGVPTSSLELPTYGISILPPRDMVQMIETTPEEIAVWSRIDKTSGRVIEVVRIEILHSEGHDLAQMAAESAKQAGGEAAKRGFKVDGMPALSCEFKKPQPPEGSDLATTAMFLTARKQLVYRASIQSAMIGGNLRASDIQPLIESWKWEPIAAPAIRLELRQQPTQVFEQFSICIPAILRPYPTDDSTEEISYGVEDYRRETTDFLMTISRIPKEKSEPFLAFWQRTAKEFQKLHPGEAVVFNQLSGLPARAVSDTIRLMRGGAVATTVYGRWILIDAPGESGVLITCKITSPYDLKAYESAIDAIATTIAPPARPAPRPTTRPAK